MKNNSTEIYKGQRVKEKQELFQRFVYRAIKEVYKKKFFELFDNRCFKCGAQENPYKVIGQFPVLCIDHHIPMILGGHLVPGNLVSLCRRCNNKKHDSPPEEFYTSAELERLKPILDKQDEIFDFTFNWNYWHKNPKDYLLSLGVEPSLVIESFDNNNENTDDNHISPDSNSHIIKFDITDILSKILKR